MMRFFCKCVGILAVFVLVGLSSCSNDGHDDSSTAPIVDTSTGETTYTVGNVVLFEQANYYVVSNTTSNEANRSAARAAENLTEDEVTELVQTDAVKRAEKYATDYFGEHILLMRISGKVQYPYGKADEYRSAKEAVTKDLPLGAKEKDYFAELSSSKTSDEDAMYSDSYLVLDKDANRLGSCEVVWSNVNKTFEGGKSLSDLLKDFSPQTIRKAHPGQYDLRRDVGTLGSFQDLSYKLNEDGTTKELASVKDTYYIYDNKSVRPAARIGTSWKADGSWEKSDIALCTYLGQAETGHGITYSVRKTNTGFEYQIKGPGKDLKDGETQYDSGKKTLAFAEGETTYTADAAVVIPENQQGLYSTHATIAYDENARSVPVDFVLNDDGSVSFGEEVYAWAKQWRDYIVQTEEKATAYEP